MGIGKEQLAELAGPGGLVLPDPRHLHPQHSPQHPYCPHQHSSPPAAAGSPLSGGASPELAGPAAGGSGAAAAAAPTTAGNGNDGGGGGGAEDLVIPYALRQLFGCVEAAKGARAFTLMVSFVEVYMVRAGKRAGQGGGGRQAMVRAGERGGQGGAGQGGDGGKVWCCCARRRWQVGSHSPTCMLTVCYFDCDCISTSPSPRKTAFPPAGKVL